MLLDKTEIEIMKTAKQVNLRDPGRSGLPFERMIDDFFDHQHFSGKVVLDLGPGQYDFNELARKRGAKGYAMDFDPAVIHLGQYKGFEIVEGDLRAISFGTFGHLFDGIFCRGSINAFWFAKNLDRLQDHIKSIASLLQDDGWGFIVPWNGVSPSLNLTAVMEEEILQLQQRVFEEEGFYLCEMSEEKAKYYGIFYPNQKPTLFVKNLTPPFFDL
jgi:hypothetical protein